MNSFTISRVLREYGIPLALFAALYSLFAIALLYNRDPWHDEAMLATNLREAGWSDLFQPMPYFEQAAPLAYVVLAHALLAIFGDGSLIFTLRALSVMATAGATVCIYVVARCFGSRWEAIFVISLAAAASFVIRYATEIKHYIFEYAATSILLLLSSKLISTTRRTDYIYFIIIGSLAITLSFTAIIPLVACMFSVLLSQAISWHYKSMKGMSVAGVGVFGYFGPTAVTFGFVLLVAGAYHVLYTIPVTRLQFESNTGNYVDYLLSGQSLEENITILKRLVKFLTPTFEPIGINLFNHGNAFIITLVVILLIGVVFSFKRSVFLGATLLCVIGIIIALNVLRIFTITHSRHFTFVIPVVALVTVLGWSEALRRATGWLGRRADYLRVALGATGAALLWINGAYSTQHLEREQISPLLSRIAHVDPEAPIWVYYGAEPAMRVLAPRRFVQLGLVDARSGSEFWITRAGVRLGGAKAETNPAYYERMRQALAGQRSVWLLFAHDWIEPNHDAYLAVARQTVGACGKAFKSIGSTLYHCGASPP
jgi:hypothetical protein